MRTIIWPPRQRPTATGTSWHQRSQRRTWNLKDGLSRGPPPERIPAWGSGTPRRPWMVSPEQLLSVLYRACSSVRRHKKCMFDFSSFYVAGVPRLKVREQLRYTIPCCVTPATLLISSSVLPQKGIAVCRELYIPSGPAYAPWLGRGVRSAEVQGHGAGQLPARQDQRGGGEPETARLDARATGTLVLEDLEHWVRALVCPTCALIHQRLAAL